MKARIEPRNKLFQALCDIIDFEINPGHTVTLIAEVDLTEIRHLREVLEVRPSYTAFVVKALARALVTFPYANRRVVPGLFGHRLQRFAEADVAVAAERALEGEEFAAFLDVLREAEQQSLDEITTWLHALATSDTSTNKQWREFRKVAYGLPRWLSRLLFRAPTYVPQMWK